MSKGGAFPLCLGDLHPGKACQGDVLDQIPALRGGRGTVLPAAIRATRLFLHTQSGDNPDPGWKVLANPKNN